MDRHEPMTAFEIDQRSNESLGLYVKLAADAITSAFFSDGFKRMLEILQTRKNEDTDSDFVAEE